jgi:WD40 repeat protein
VYDLAWHPREPAIVFLSQAGRLYRCDVLKDTAPRALGPAKMELRALQFDPSGQHFTYVTSGGTVGVCHWETGTTWDTDQKAFQIALYRHWLATPGPAHEVVLYDLRSRRKVLILPAEGCDIWSLAWSPNGRRLAVGLSDGGLAVWDLEQVRARLMEFGIRIAAATD